MEFKVSSNKSNGIKKLRELFPGGWSVGSNTEKYDLILIDALQGLIGFKNGTGYDCAMRCSHLVRKYSQDDLYCPRKIILCFDDQIDVPLAKAAEQALRKSSVMKKKEATEIVETEKKESYRDLPSPGIWLEKNVPYDFDEGLQDREGYRRAVIRFLCKQWIFGPDSVRLHPNYDCSIIITGHCLRREDLMELVNNDKTEFSKLNLNHSDDPRHIPVMIGEDKFDLCPEYRHRLGEADMLIFSFY